MDQLETFRTQLDRIERNTLLCAKSVLTVDDVALLTGQSKRTIYRLTSARQIPYYKPNGKTIYFSRADVEKWLLQNRLASDTEISQHAINEIVIPKVRAKRTKQ